MRRRCWSSVPTAEDGTPFPTTLWLSCRALVEAVGRLESHGGVAAFEDELGADAGLRADHARAEARVRARRAALAGAATDAVDGGAALRAGIAGGEPGAGLKCLHAHAAVALAEPPYRLGALVLERADARYPERCCAC